MSEGKIIYQLQDLKKFYDQREVLKGITIAFLEGANIGLIGPNGAGKSTLLRILAGEDRDIEGTARPIQGLSIGYLQQEPPLDETKTVGENIDLGVAPLRALEARYYEVMNIMGEAEGQEAEKLSAEYDELQIAMDTKGIWDLDSRLEQAAQARQVPPFESG
ncbi:MAG: ATP-binding cassette domain-containing protein, partial [Planctomycetota bacterium]|nr:ATP-binding cassette domain-containing protein [Planctomycetota bacterium]